MSCNDNNRTYQSDSKLFKDSFTNHKTPKPGKVKKRFRFCFKFAAFVCSHVGLGFLVLTYTILGAFVFRHFEASSVKHRSHRIVDIRNSTVNKLWTETYNLNVLYKENWTAMAIREIEEFQRVLVEAMREGYSPGEENKSYTRWSFTDSWMYSISIITTIGYANRPTTSEGKVATIVYALFGIPIMLLFLSTIGNLLGRGLKFLYSFCCTCSSETSSGLVPINTGGGHSPASHQHHHHLHEDYQVHHIALNNMPSGNRHVVACNSTAAPLVNHSYANHQSFSQLNSTYNPLRCPCELEAESKLCAEPLDHLCSDKLTYHHQQGHSHNLVTESESQLFANNCKEDLSKLHSHASLSNSIYEETPRETVPLYFCFFLIILYILCGGFLFYFWEGWSLLDGAYFCFVTLSTIGFGEIIPEKTLALNQTESKKRIILIVLYILGGMTLIAMSFNLIYEQLAYKLRNFGHKFQLNSETPTGVGGGGREIKIVTNQFINTTEDIDV